MIPDQSIIKVNMWRETDNKKVWYEWLIETFIDSRMSGQQIGISELHSSKENGCLM